MRPKVTLRITPEARTKAVALLRQYAADNLEEPIGDLKATLLLDFVLEEIGPTLYNQGVADAQAFMAERVVDLEATCHHAEFPSWGKTKR